MGQPDHRPGGVRVHEVVHAVRERPRPSAYPKIAAVTSFNDTRVLYVEPAKWVQRLRERDHRQRADRDEDRDGRRPRRRFRPVRAVEERAWDYAFVADSLGATELLPGAGLK